MKTQAVPVQGYKWVIAVLAVLTVTSALGFARFGYSMILPGMRAGLALSDVRTGDLATANLAGYLAVSLVGGILASRFGPRIVISVSLFLTAAGMALTGLADSYGAALAARFLTGMASGGANVPVMGLLSSWFSARERGLAGGMAVGGSSLAIFFTGTVVPVFMSRFGAFGWRASWFLLAAVSALIACLCSGLLRNGPTNGKGKSAGTPAGASFRTIVSLPAVWALGLVYALFGFSYIIYATFFVRYLSSEAGFPLETAGAWWSLVGGLSAASGFLWGTVSDRLGRKYGLALVFFLQGLSYCALGAWKSTAGIVVSCVLFAVTAWSIPAIVAAASGDLLGAKTAPAALGFLTVFMGAGQALGPFVAGRIAGGSGSWSGAFVLAGSFALAGAAVSLFLRKQGSCTG